MRNFMLKSIISVLAILWINIALAQPPGTSWTLTFGGGGDDIGAKVQQTRDGGFVITGYSTSNSSGYYRVVLIKTDSEGGVSWTRVFADDGNSLGHDVQQTSDGGYVVTGFSDSCGANSNDLWLAKADQNGYEIWMRTFGGGNDDKGHCIQQTDDGGYIVAGETTSSGAGGRDFWLIRTNSLGNEIWNRTYGGVLTDYCHGVQQTFDGGYILAGTTESYGSGGYDFWLIKTDSFGSEQWSRTFGGYLGDCAHAVLQTEDGGYVLGGCTWSCSAGGCDFWLIKTDSSGVEQWNRTFEFVRE